MLSLFSGPIAALRALGLMIKHPTVIALAAIPAAVALLISIAAVWASIAYGGELLAWMWPEPADTTGFFGTIAGWLWTFFNWVARLSTAALSVFVTPWLVMLLGFPLCEPMAMKIDALVGGEAVEASLASELAKAFTATIGVTLIGLAGAVVLFMVGLIPGMALITTPFLMLVWTPLFLAFDLFDGSLSRRQLGFRQKLRFITGRLIGAISVGLTGTVLVAVPLLNLIGLPVAVAMAVLVVRDREKADALPT
jgi:CysZ protein